MMRVVRLIIATDFDDWQPSETAQTVIEAENEDKFTGLLDAQGNPIPKRRPRVPMGFHVKHK